MDCVSLVALLFGVYGKTAETERQSMYVMFLSDIPAELLELSVKKLVRESPFLPSVADIIKTSKSFYVTLNPEMETLSFDEAWHDIMTAISKYGLYRTPCFKHEVTKEIVKKLGWHYLCTAPENYGGAVRMQAEKVFNAIVCRQNEDAANEYYLTGNNIFGIPKVEDIVAKLSRKGVNDG